MSCTVATTHIFDHLYAGSSATEIHSSSCDDYFARARRPRKCFINEAGSRHFRNLIEKRHREFWKGLLKIDVGSEPLSIDPRSYGSTATFIYPRDNLDFKLDEVNL